MISTAVSDEIERETQRGGSYISLYNSWVLYRYLSVYLEFALEGVGFRDQAS